MNLKPNSGGSNLVLTVVALVVLIPLAAIYVIEAITGKGFSAPDPLTSLALVVVTFFFSHGAFLGAQASTAALVTSLTSGTSSNSSAASTSSDVPTPAATPGSPTATAPGTIPLQGGS